MRGIIQGCQWHKQENVVSYPAEDHQDEFRRKLQKAYNEESYELARNLLQEIHEQLIVLNRSAANSLKVGLEETLTTHRLGLMSQFGKSFTTTNCIESFNFSLEKYAGKVTRWLDSNQKYRCAVMAGLEMEERMHKVGHHKKHHLMLSAQIKEAHKKSKEPLEPENISTKN